MKMTESERPHRTGRSTSNFFICFSSRSSSSMKMSSKSILSPGRTDKFREPSISLSSSLSRRLKSNGSMKGGQSSPMFSTGSKKKGSCAFETAEPSSPKVTCIGQVRVKTKKKQGKKLRTRSKRRGEVSFRKIEQTPEGIVRQHAQQQQDCLPHRNQRWVHLPLTICEALRASCSWTSERKAEKRRTTPTSTSTSTSTSTITSSCGAVFANWLWALWALQEDEEKRRDMKLEVREEEKREIREKVVGDGEIEIDISGEKGEEEEIDEEEEEGRVSICIPPRNALLLMRCRSEPFRMSAFANHFWDSEASKDEEENVEEQSAVEEEEHTKVKLEPEEVGEEEILEKWVSADSIEESPEDPDKEEQQEQENLENAEQQEELIHEEEQELEHKGEEVMVSEFSPEAIEDEKDNLETEESKLEEEEEEYKEKGRGSVSYSTESIYAEESSETEPGPAVVADLEERVEKSTKEKETEEETSEEEEEEEEEEERSAVEAEHKQQINNHEEEEEEEYLLPDWLLLMCEPKLSMEVSKETWVCSRDFIRRRHPEKQVVPMDGGDKLKKRLSIDCNLTQVHPAQQQQIMPPRLSCSKLERPAVDPSMATMIEQKLGNAVAYEPFVLKRCKSEPMRSSAKQTPEACFWKNRKMEPHHVSPNTLGVGAAGIGF